MLNAKSNKVDAPLSIVVVRQSNRSAPSIKRAFTIARVLHSGIESACVYPLIPNSRIAFPPRIFSLSSSEIPFIALIGAMVFGQVEIASP